MATAPLATLDGMEATGLDWGSDSPVGKWRPPELSVFEQEPVLELDGVTADLGAGGVQIFSMVTPPGNMAGQTKMHYIGSPAGSDQAIGDLFSGEDKTCLPSGAAGEAECEVCCMVEEFSPMASPRCSSEASTPRTCSPVVGRKPRKLQSSDRMHPGSTSPGPSPRSHSTSSSCSTPRGRAPSHGALAGTCAAQLPSLGAALREIVAANEALLQGILNDGPIPTEEDVAFDSDFELELPDTSIDLPDFEQDILL